MTISPNGASIWADGPSTSVYHPPKPLIRQWAAVIEAALNALTTGAGSIAKDTRANLYADLAFAAGTMAWVYDDATAAYNGIYVKSGASGTGSWTRILSLPYSYLLATDTGTGTPNAINATTDIAVSEDMLIMIELFTTTTDEPATISFNGGVDLTIKTNRGTNASALTAGMVMAGKISGSTFRLITDEDVSALVDQAEAARDAAVTAQAAVEAGLDNRVRYDATQVRTDIEKALARSNIGAASEAQGVLADSALQGGDIIYPLSRLPGTPTLHSSGVLDYTSIIQTAINAGKKILLPEGTTYVSGLILIDGSVIKGAHILKSKLKLLNGSNAHLLATDDFDSQFGTVVSDEVPRDITINNLTIDGNRANNTDGHGIALYARRMCISWVFITNIAGKGITCDYNDSAGGGITPGDYGSLGMESIFEYIWMDYTGAESMDMRGPHDSSLNNVHAIHASQNGNAAYPAFRFQSTFTARGRNLHAYNSGTVNNHSWGIYDAAGCEISDSHFEGAAIGNVLLLQKGAMYKGVRAYATRNGAYNVVLAANECQFYGFIGGAASGTAPKGITFGRDGSDYAQANIVEVIAVDQNSGTVDFSYSQGQNKITVRGEQASGAKVIGTPAINDTHDIVISGVRYGGANSIPAAGTISNTSTQLTAKTNRVTAATAGSADGVKLPPGVGIVGQAVTVSNVSSAIIKVYPNGTDFIDVGGATPSFVRVAPGRTVEFVAIYYDGSANTAWSPIVSASVPAGANNIAAAGATSGTATQLTAKSNRVTSVTSGSADGVKLPAAVGYLDDYVAITNITATALKVYPNGSDILDYGGSNPASVSIPAGKAAIFFCPLSGAWSPVIGA